jgi:DNA replication protein DnaC
LVHEFLGKIRETKPAYCLACEDEILRTDKGQSAQARVSNAMETFNRSIPVRYRETLTNHPDFNHSLFEAVRCWQPTPEQPFLGIIGPTGVCKTRCAVLRGKKFAREGSEVRMISGSDFAESVRNRFGENSGTHLSLLQQVERAKILILDDLTKIRPTDAVAEALFELIEKRMRRNSWTIWTANRSIEQFVQPMPEEYREPLLGRIVEASHIIEV